MDFWKVLEIKVEAKIDFLVVFFRFWTKSELIYSLRTSNFAIPYNEFDGFSTFQQIASKTLSRPLGDPLGIPGGPLGDLLGTLGDPQGPLGDPQEPPWSHSRHSPSSQYEVGNLKVASSRELSVRAASGIVFYEVCLSQTSYFTRCES